MVAKCVLIGIIFQKENFLKPLILFVGTNARLTIEKCSIMSKSMFIFNGNEYELKMRLLIFFICNVSSSN